MAEGSHYRHNSSLLQREIYLVPTLRKEKKEKKKPSAPSLTSLLKDDETKMNRVIPKPASRHHAALIRYFSFATAPEITNIYANTSILD